MSRGLRSHQGRKVRRIRRQGLYGRELKKLIETIKNDPNMITQVQDDGKITLIPKFSDIQTLLSCNNIDESGQNTPQSHNKTTISCWKNPRKIKRNRLKRQARNKKM
ncbi:hypothetical protein GJ496_005205 [Pomphorhynchus laevis]|nr:hypothetical protein GJ496_005205 [Pomphorhynchus laevis]